MDTRIRIVDDSCNILASITNRFISRHRVVQNRRTLSATDQPCVHAGLEDKEGGEAARDPLLMWVEGVDSEKHH